MATDASPADAVVDDAGHSFEEDAVRYACTLHESVDARGTVVVGEDVADGAPAAAASAAGVRSLGNLLTLGFGGALAAALLGLPMADRRARRDDA